jgi:hypothetical protein
MKSNKQEDKKIRKGRRKKKQKGKGEKVAGTGLISCQVVRLGVICSKPVHRTGLASFLMALYPPTEPVWHPF